MRLLHLELYCAMARSSIRRTRGNDGLGVEGRNDVLLEKRAGIVQLIERKLFELLAVFFCNTERDCLRLRELHGMAFLFLPGNPQRL